MARSIQTIQSEMDIIQATQSGLSSLNSPSTTSIYTLWKYITSSSIWIHETLWDLFKVELETIVSNAPVGTVKWLQNMVFNFQYDSSNPQIVQLVDFTPSYNPIDPTLRIVTRCSTKTTPGRLVTVKVAKSEPPSALSLAELNSLKGYLNDISFAGVQYIVTSSPADKLYLDAEIFYNGQYASTISANVISAVEDYLKNIPFDGEIRISKLEDAIQSVIGVTDVIINDMALRADATSFGSKTYLVQTNTTIFNKYPTNAGYIVQETTTGETFLDKLTFTVE
jgi:hypothetical protein